MIDKSKIHAAVCDRIFQYRKERKYHPQEKFWCRCLFIVWEGRLKMSHLAT